MRFIYLSIFVITSSLLFLVSCDAKFRYPCQDPDNWGKKACQRPYCTAIGACPEDLVQQENKSVKSSTSTGVCK